MRFGTGYLSVHIVEENIIVDATLHFDELDLRLFGAQRVNVHQFSIIFVETAGDDIRQRVGGIQRCKRGDAQKNGVVMQADIIVDGIHIRLARIDDIIHFSLVHEFQYFVARGEAIDGRHFDAEGADGIRRARGR